MMDHLGSDENRYPSIAEPAKAIRRVRHLAQALGSLQRVILPLPAAPDEIAERSEQLLLAHVARFEQIGPG